jgi:hypothetical protein
MKISHNTHQDPEKIKMNQELSIPDTLRDGTVSLKTLLKAIDQIATDNPSNKKPT